MYCRVCGKESGESDICENCKALSDNCETVAEDVPVEATEPTAESVKEVAESNAEPASESNEPIISSGNSAPKKSSKKAMIIGIAAAVALVVILLIVLLSKPKVTKISATYEGDTSDGITLNEKNKGIVVSGKTEKGKTVELSGWTIEDPESLEADGSATVVITYKDCSTKLTVKCSTSKAVSISASYDGNLEDGAVVNCGNISVIATLKNGEEVDVSGDCEYSPDTVTMKTDGSETIEITYNDSVTGEDLSTKLELVCSTMSIESISAKYTGKTSDGTVINEQNGGIKVTAVLKDGTTKELTGWKIAEPKTLRKDESVEVEITYGDSSCVLEVTCSDMSEGKYKERCKVISYDSLSRQPGKYEGEYIKVSGKVFQVVSEASSSFYYSVYFIRSNGNLYKVKIDNYGSGYRILEGDSITVWGTYDGIYTYETVRGNSNSIPEMTAEYYN